MGVDLPAGVMLWGPLGLGITMLAEAAAKEAEATFVYVSGQEMLGKMDRMEEAFGVAVREAPSVFFISDIDWLCPRAGASYTWGNGNLRGKPPTFADAAFTARFLALLDSLLPEGRVRLAGSCYRIDVVDQAAILAVEEGIERVALRHFLAALADITPWLTPDMVEGYLRIFREDCPITTRSDPRRFGDDGQEDP
jgi:ATP-dependent 26S proteasome regulatory subunit